MEIQIPSEIKIKLSESHEVTEKYRQNIHTLLEQKIFDIKNGQAILNFDEDGSLRAIEIRLKAWKKVK